MVTNHYLEPVSFKNKFQKSPKTQKNYELPQNMFTFEMQSSQISPSRFNDNLNPISKPLIKLPANISDPPSLHVTVTNTIKFLSSTKVESGEIISSFTESSRSDKNLDLFKAKIENKKCLCPDILIVDDHTYNLHAFQMIASKLPFKLTIDTANSGEEALEKIRKFYENSRCSLEFKCYSYKCIFLDYDMPNKNGVETMNDINEYFKEKNYSPVVAAWTAFDDKTLKEECKQAGMIDYLSKPFALNDLQRILVKRALPQYI